MKAILLVEIDDDHKLKDINDLYDRMKGRWCELKPMPKRKLHEYEQVDDEYGYVEGWNACLDEITGRTE